MDHQTCGSVADAGCSRSAGPGAKSIARERRLDTIAASHAERCAALGTQALDARTWADLDLDDVFVALDRTTSTLGQHALYHRLRTAPVGDHLDEFETLVERMRGDDATARERAQLALSRLQDPQGYDVWWLGAADALERQPWYSLFPVLTAVTVALAVAALFWTAAVVALVAMVAVNMAVRYATDERTIAIARSFRQLAPLIATAESLRFLDDSAHAVHHRCSSRRCAVARTVEADLTMGQRQPVHVVVQLERAGARRSPISSRSSTST